MVQVHNKMKSVKMSIIRLITENLHELSFNCIIPDSKPKSILVVDKKSVAKDNLVSKFSKLTTYFREQLCIFKCCALMWSALVHHTSREG